MSFHQLNICVLVILTLTLLNQSNGEDEKLLCLFTGTVRFSTNDANAYYECNPEYQYALLVYCKPNEFYSTETETCLFATTEKGTNRSRRAASGEAEKSNDAVKVLNYIILDQDVRLGDLYDAKNNQHLSGTSLWSTEVLKKVKNDNRNKIGAYEYLYKAGKTTTERLDIMDIKAELRLDFLGGLISVTGSAGFARKEDLTEIDETFTLVYKSLSYSATVPKSTPVTFNKECKNKYATHVVNKITYGQNAYFFFKRTLQKNEQSQEVSGSLQVVVKSIPSFSIEGKASIDLKGELKELAQSTEVQYNGDFRLSSGIPTTFDGAVKTFSGLSELTAKGPDYTDAVPIKVQLTPLSEYCDASNAILASIGESAMTAVSKALEELEFLEMKVNTLLRTNPAILYPAVKENLVLYKTHLQKYQIEFKGKLQQLLPAIRGRTDGKSEEDLLKLLIEYKKSPLEKAKSVEYLLKREREITAINYLTEGFNTASQENFDIADYKRANGVRLLINYRKVIILSVNILLSPQVTQNFLAGKKINESNFWYEHNPSVGLLGRQKSLFKSFAMANKNSKDYAFFIQITKRDPNAFSVSAQYDGVSDPKPFVTPDIPVKPIPVSHSHNSFAIKVERPTATEIINSWVTKFHVEYWRLTDGPTNGMKRQTFDFSKTTVAIIINLQPLTMYQYRIVHYTEFGLSPVSEISDVTTTPCSEPANLKLKTTLEQSLSFSWDAPIAVGAGITIDGYKATLYAANKIYGEKTMEVKEVLFGNLNPSTEYQIKIVAIASKFESLPTTMVGYTSPAPPHSVNLVKADLYTITFTWSQPKIATGANVEEYFVRYIKMDNAGSEPIVGTQKIQSALKKTSVSITSLAQGTTYGFSIQIITTLGRSKYSNSLIARTQYSKTDFDKLRDQMNTNQKTELAKLKQEIESKSATHIQNLEKKIAISRRADLTNLENRYKSSLKNTNMKVTQATNDIRMLKSNNNIEGYKHIWTVSHSACIRGNNHRKPVVHTYRQCKQACDTANFACRSIDFNIKTRVCHLSKADSSNPDYTRPCYFKPLVWIYAQITIYKESVIGCTRTYYEETTQTTITSCRSRCSQQSKCKAYSLGVNKKCRLTDVANNLEICDGTSQEKF